VGDGAVVLDDTELEVVDINDVIAKAVIELELKEATVIELEVEVGAEFESVVKEREEVVDEKVSVPTSAVVVTTLREKVLGITLDRASNVIPTGSSTPLTWPFGAHPTFA
jgi:hypothetical protein